MIPKGGAVVETCSRTIHGRALLCPGFEANERILGCLGRAADYYKVQLFNFSFSSTHCHLQYWADHSLHDYAMRYEIELQPMPCFSHLSPMEYREMIADLIREMEEEGAADREERSFPVLGAERILAEHPHRAVGGGELFAAPVLFAASRETRVSMKEDYKAFVTDYESASERLLAAAQNGGRIEPSILGFPHGSFPPAACSGELLSGGLEGVFNTELEFPPRSFPRPWPFLGGTLPLPPPTPPTRRLVYQDEETTAWV